MEHSANFFALRKPKPLLCSMALQDNIFLMDIFGSNRSSGNANVCTVQI